MSIPHPTGSTVFAAEIAALGYPAPWHVDHDVPGEVYAANNRKALHAGSASHAAGTRFAIAHWIVLAVNTLAGYRALAEIDDGLH